jgi:hypothetical protein
MAEGDRPIDGPEGLPLYFDPIAKRSYRPSISARTEQGGITTFLVSFTLLPLELTAWPTGDTGDLLHYLDFARMMRWGVLEEPGIVDLFRTAEGSSDPENAIREFIGKILSIRTEFWNRGLQSDSLERAVQAEFREEVKRLLQKYRDAIALIDPKRRGFAQSYTRFSDCQARLRYCLLD